MARRGGLGDAGVDHPHLARGVARRIRWTGSSNIGVCPCDTTGLVPSIRTRRASGSTWGMQRVGAGDELHRAVLGRRVDGGVAVDVAGVEAAGQAAEGPVARRCPCRCRRRGRSRRCRARDSRTMSARRWSRSPSDLVPGRGPLLAVDAQQRAVEAARRRGGSPGARGPCCTCSRPRAGGRRRRAR